MQAGLFHPTHNQSVDLGDEAPLMVYDERNQLPDKKKVSLRWLSGTILTGLTSVFLMGGAMIAALDGQYRVSAAPSRDADTAALENERIKTKTATKGDRVARSGNQHSSRQIIPVSTVNRIDGRDHIKVRPYALVTATLATRRSLDLQGEIPSFNPVDIFSEGKTPAERATSDAVYEARVDGEVSISVSDFPIDSPLLDEGLERGEAEIERLVRASARFLLDNEVDIAAQPVVDPARFDFTLARQSAFSRLDVRITPENVSFKSKTGDSDAYAGMEEKIIPVTAGVELRDILLENEATEEEADQVLAAFQRIYGIDKLQDGQRIRLALSPAEDASNRMRPERISLYSDIVHEASVARSDNGTFVEAEAPTTVLADAFAEADRLGYSGPTPSLYDSLYQTSLEQEVPNELIEELVRVFSFDVDFKSRVKPGDSLEIFYGLEDENSETPPEILYTSLRTGGTPRKFYRFRTPDDGVVDFYDETGKSAKKFLMRKPLSGGRFRSAFGLRKHPILGSVKMHNGVDWAAGRGTPIMAAGDGTVIKAKWAAGYGRRIEIKHANGYVTTYSHQSQFAKGIREGARVSQGQVIGYIGSTGLSTGPHLHYEVLVNGRFVNPMRIRLPRGRVLEGDMLAAFERERDRIDALIERGSGPSRVASATN
ncbi:M23 family metallopeptidase [Rhizobiales bacterium]|uniref:M23 family metallopeptidase n=1 Tax=Hongsoonwoonella zoysiae TaxID=2821844 RepID=UPI00155F94B9|nr:M23 family metallopeptidase [Hongsoonwoonella zoysiae]NRG17195.1 M23 family metallopeptidase [Hongsoonwoonella zoysiae]